MAVGIRSWSRRYTWRSRLSFIVSIDLLQCKTQYRHLKQTVYLNTFLYFHRSFYYLNKQYRRRNKQKQVQAVIKLPVRVPGKNIPFAFPKWWTWCHLNCNIQGSLVKGDKIGTNFKNLYLITNVSLQVFHLHLFHI